MNLIFLLLLACGEITTEQIEDRIYDRVGITEQQKLYEVQKITRFKLFIF